MSSRLKKLPVPLLGRPYGGEDRWWNWDELGLLGSFQRTCEPMSVTWMDIKSAYPNELIQQENMVALNLPFQEFDIECEIVFCWVCSFSTVRRQRSVLWRFYLTQHTPWKRTCKSMCAVVTEWFWQKSCFFRLICMKFRTCWNHSTDFSKQPTNYLKTYTLWKTNKNLHKSMTLRDITIYTNQC